MTNTVRISGAASSARQTSSLFAGATVVNRHSTFGVMGQSSPVAIERRRLADRAARATS